jgi:hypothetical protein
VKKKMDVNDFGINTATLRSYFESKVRTVKDNADLIAFLR